MNVTKSLAAVALVAALSLVAYRVVAPPDGAPANPGATDAVTMKASDASGSDREAPLQVADTGAPRAPLAAPETPSSESGTATLRVRVVDEDNVGVHLAGVVVAIDGVARGTNAPRAEVETDRDGYWSDTVPAGKGLVVYVSCEDAGPDRLSVAPIASDTTFETTVRVRTRPDLDVVLSVVGAATSEPISGARVFLVSRSAGSTGRDHHVLPLQPEAACDYVTVADGTARMRVKSWQNVSCRVHAEGFAPREQSVHRAEASNTVEPVLVPLTRGARIVGRVTGAPVVASVRASFPSSSIAAPEVIRDFIGGVFRAANYELRVKVDDGGEFIVPDLPGGTAVTLALHDTPSDALRYRPAAPIVTVAGEDHQVTFELGAMRRIVCTVREADSAAAADIEVVQFTHGEARVGATPDGRRKWSQSARTDDAGVALFDAVAPGAWLVGLAPSGKGERAFAAYTVAVDVPDTPGDVHIDLLLHRGLFIEGRVVAPEGGSPMLFVNAHNDRFDLTAMGHEIVAGQFRLGPLLPGLYKVSAGAFGSPYAPPKEVEVAAGTTDLELVLRPGARLVLSAIDAVSRQPVVDAEFMLGRASGEGGLLQGGGAKPPAKFSGLEPGTYCALALAADGRVGVLESISLPSTEPVEAVVPLAPGGTLVLRAAIDGVPRNVYVLRGDAVVKLHQLDRSAEERSVLPPGRYRVGVQERPRDQLRSASTPRFDAVFEVDVIVGEEVTLDVAPR